MKELYISVDVIDYGNGYIDCGLYQQIDEETPEITILDVNHANKLIWELVLAGGCKEVSVNQFDRNIVRKNAYIFLPI